MCRLQQPTRFGPNFANKICAGFISNTTPRDFIQTGRCFVTSSGLPISITREFREWKRRWMNICAGRMVIVTSDMMEPGSTFKIVTAAAALNEKKVRPDTTIFCENGAWNYGGRTLHDHHPYGELSVQDILVKSSNIGAAKLGLSLGDQKFYEYIR